MAQGPETLVTMSRDQGRGSSQAGSGAEVRGQLPGRLLSL